MREHYALYLDYGHIVEAVLLPEHDTRERVIQRLVDGDHRGAPYEIRRADPAENAFDDVTEDVLEEAWERARDKGAGTVPDLQDAIDAYRKRKRQQAEAERGSLREAVNV